MAAADQKRSSVAGRAPTPKANSAPQGISDMDAALSKAIGGRIRVTMTAPVSATYEGTIFAACPITNLLAINTATTAGPADIRIIPVSQINSFELLSMKATDRASGFGTLADASLSIAKVDMAALRAREADAIAKAKEHEATRGKGVTKEAQEIFDWFKRTLPTRWNGQTIIVNDAVLVEPPYAVENCRAQKDSKQAEAQIKRVLEGFYQKRKGAGGNASSSSNNNNSTTTSTTTATGSAVNSGTSTPVTGSGRTVVPALPRKGG